jgi:hypothetical protein
MIYKYLLDSFKFFLKVDTWVILQVNSMPQF